MTASPEQFVDALAGIQLKNVFNPYRDLCDLHDRPDAVSRRRRNLELGLTAAVDMGVDTIWIARDLGYRGGRRTGLALTDETHLDAYSALFHGLPIQKATRGPTMGERTANIIWRMLSRLTQPVFLWNVFPLHPHDSDNPMTNRCHTAGERDTCADLLYAIMDILRPDQVLAIGGDAHKAVAGMGIDSVRVRHPSYGGQNVFIRQIEEAYALEPVPTGGLPLFDQVADGPLQDAR